MGKLNESEQQKVKLAQKLYRARKESSSQVEDLKFLEQVESSDIVIVKGSYDYIENVFELTGIPYTLIEPEQVRLIEFRPEQIVFVNCPGQIDMTGVEKLVGFVRRGGYLITTDWALKNVLERGFPGIVEYNNQPTGDEVVRIEVKDWDNPIKKSRTGTILSLKTLSIRRMNRYGGWKVPRIQLRSLIRKKWKSWSCPRN
ncbi:MAG: hypothetical protein ACTSRU_13280 [Candidatus Hodarchaeales archaeon]